MMQEVAELLEDPWFTEGCYHEVDILSRLKAVRFLDAGVAAEPSAGGFTVSGEGKSGSDFWRAYYKGGRCYTKQIVFDFPDCLGPVITTKGYFFESAKALSLSSRAIINLNFVQI